MAHTTKDWPRRISPAANIPGTEDIWFWSVATLPRAIESDAKLFNHPIANRTEETHGDQHQVSFQGEVGAGERLKSRGRTYTHGMKVFDAVPLPR